MIKRICYVMLCYDLGLLGMNLLTAYRPIVDYGRLQNTKKGKYKKFSASRDFASLTPS